MGYMTSALVLIGLFLVTEIIHIIRAVIWYVRYYKLKYSERLSSTKVESIPDKNSRPISVAVVTDGGATVLPERLFCRKCGKQIPNDSEFCYKCGTRVDAATERSVAEHSAMDAVKSCFAEKYKEIEPKSVVSSEKGKKHKRLCPNCGDEIPSPMWKICPHCGEKLPQPKKTVVDKTDDRQSRYKKAVSILESSNDIAALREARDTFIVLGDYLDSDLNIQKCMDKIYRISK